MHPRIHPRVAYWLRREARSPPQKATHGFEWRKCTKKADTRRAMCWFMLISWITKMTRFDTQNRGSMCTLTRFDTHKIFLKKTVNGGQLTEIYLEIDMFDTILYPLSFRWPQEICVRPCHCVSLRVIYRYAFRVIPCRSVSFQVKGVEFLRFLSKSKPPCMHWGRRSSPAFGCWLHIYLPLPLPALHSNRLQSESCLAMYGGSMRAQGTLFPQKCWLMKVAAYMGCSCTSGIPRRLPQEHIYI